MVFSSCLFLFYFLPALLVCYFIVPRRFRQVRNGILLVFSLVFYGCAGAKFLLLMGASILINYTGGLLAAGQRGRKAALAVTVAANLALLGWFKYAGFLASMIAAVGVAIPIPQITLPVGISFFTFQGMSYVIDVYRQPDTCQRNPLKLALYISLFPQLVAGPIVRYSDIATEIDHRRENLTDFSEGLTRFCFGLGKKMLLANPFGAIADGVFNLDMGAVSTPAAWVGALAYTLQIYFDFSAYSDMAIGLGKLFGFHFSENFNYPYISRSITEFWRRWHISLSSWFRDYVYIPLGGSRTARWKHVRNILVVWILTGLWHGAAWNFIFWGLWYGLLLLGEKFLWPGLLKKGPEWLHWLATMVIVVVGWVFFRGETLPVIFGMLKAMCGFGAEATGQGIYYLVEYWPEWLVGLAACLPVKQLLEKKLSPESALRVWAPKLLAAGIFALSYGTLITSSFNPFLYFRF